MRKPADARRAAASADLPRKDDVDVLIAAHCKVSRLKRHAACDEGGPWCGLDIPPVRVDRDWSRVTCWRCWEAKRRLEDPCPACWPIVVWVREYCEYCRRRRRWADALAELRALQAEYEAWREQLPEALAESRTAELLEGVCDVDLDALDIELPPLASARQGPGPRRPRGSGSAEEGG